MRNRKDVVKSNLRPAMRLRKWSRETGELLSDKTTPVSAGHGHSTLDAGAIARFVALIAGTSSEHLSTADTWIGVGNADPIVSFTWTRVTDSGPGATADTQSEPALSYLWTFEDFTATARSNLNYAELWYLDPEGASTEWRVFTINGAWGNKPTTENWQWDMIMEFFSADTDFVVAGITDIVRAITGQNPNHLDDNNTWFRPFTSGDVGSGSGGQNPDAVPTVDSDRLTWVWTINGSTFNTAWDRVEIASGTTYGGSLRIRYGGCNTDDTGCGTKVSSEIWTYTYVLILVQG